MIEQSLFDLDTWLNVPWLRYFNAAVSMLVVFGLTFMVLIKWSTLPVGVKRIAPWIVTTYVIIAYGSIEVARLDMQVPTGARVLLLSLNLVGLAGTLAFNFVETSRGEPSTRLRDDLRTLVPKRRVR